MIAFLESQKLAKQKFPEKLLIVQELPHNAAGKVLKHILKDQVKGLRAE
jgi:acyl-CoA synthetase (AMP-forming)/AMP-acid ligase II